MRKDVRTFSDDRSDPRWGARFLGILLAIPVAGLLGLPLLLLLLILFLGNPGDLGERLSQSRPLKNLPGFRSGRRGRLAVASLAYLLPLSILGIVVVGIDSIVLSGMLRQ